MLKNLSFDCHVFMFCLQQMPSYLVKGEKSCLCKNDELSENEFLLWRCVQSDLHCALIFFPSHSFETCLESCAIVSFEWGKGTSI